MKQTLYVCQSWMVPWKLHFWIKTSIQIHPVDLFYYQKQLLQVLFTCWTQNNNLERALDWIFTHPEPEESDALSDMADTEPNDNAFSNANSHSDATLSPDRDTTGPRIKDGPGRKWGL